MCVCVCVCVYKYLSTFCLLYSPQSEFTNMVGLIVGGQMCRPRVGDSLSFSTNG